MLTLYDASGELLFDGMLHDLADLPDVLSLHCSVFSPARLKLERRG